MTATGPRTRWRACAPDGIAHAFAGPTARALCGHPNQVERFDWPARVRCALCLVREEAAKRPNFQVPAFPD